MGFALYLPGGESLAAPAEPVSPHSFRGGWTEGTELPRQRLTPEVDRFRLARGLEP
jgi:hypothetical protein